MLLCALIKYLCSVVLFVSSPLHVLHCCGLISSLLFRTARHTFLYHFAAFISTDKAGRWSLKNRFMGCRYQFSAAAHIKQAPETSHLVIALRIRLAPPPESPTENINRMFLLQILAFAQYCVADSLLPQKHANRIVK